MNEIKRNSLVELVPFEVTKLRTQNQRIDNISSYSLKQTDVNSRECPFCGSHHVHSNGNYKGRKRYLCKNCGKSYNDLTNTPFSGIHDLDKFKQYLKCMINGDTIRRAAKIVNVSATTSFSWRHKLLNKFKKLPSPNMKNVRELMEVEIPYSHKGQNRKLTDSLRKSKVSAMFICDRTGKLDSDSITLSQRNKNPLFTRISGISDQHTDIICTTNFNNIIQSSEVNIKNAKYTKPRIIPYIITLWQAWMKRFHGVASKYLSNYLHWFDYLDNSLYNPDKIPNLVQLLLKR